MKRREFLKVAGTSMAGLALVPSFFASCNKEGGTGNNTNVPVEKPTGHFSLWQLTSTSDTIGNAYVLKTAEGNLIIVDGGHSGNTDGDKLLNYIKSQGKGKVKAWWFSHPHADHIGAFMNITAGDLDKLDIEIETIYHSRLATAVMNKENSGNNCTLFYNRLAALEARGTKIVDLQTLGARYDMDGIFIKVLGVANPEFTTASEGTSVYNEQSVIVRFEDDSKSVVFLGDASEQAGTKAVTKYQKYLCCDYLQMAHHGQRGVRQSFYNAIDFKHCLWPTPKWLWETTEQDNIDGTKPYKTWQTREWMKAKGIPDENHHVAWRDVDWYLP